MLCERCGALVSSESAFCANCGNALQHKNAVCAESATTTQLTCEKCSMIYSAGLASCPHCHSEQNQTNDTPSSTPKKKQLSRRILIITLSSLAVVCLLGFLFLRNSLIETDSYYDHDTGRHRSDYRYYGSFESLIENERDLIAELAATGGECVCNDYTITGTGEGALDMLDFDYVIHDYYSSIDTQQTDYYNRFPDCNEYDIIIYQGERYGEGPAYLFERYTDVYSFYDWFN